MKTQKFKRTLSLFLAMLMCVTTLFGMERAGFAGRRNRRKYTLSPTP